MAATPRVLHVDDDPRILSVSRSTARETAAFDLVTAQTASEALEAVENADVDAVITDSLTTSEGVPLVRAIRQRKPDLPVLLFTASDRPAAADGAAATAYVQKGGGVDAVFETVRTLVEASTVDSSVSASRDVSGQSAGLADAADDEAVSDGDWTLLGVHDWSGPQELGTTIVQLLADHVDRDSDGHRPLYRSVDPDSLEQLLGPRLDGGLREEVQVRFTYERHEIAVSSDGSISVRPRTADVDWLDPSNADAE